MYSSVFNESASSLCCPLSCWALYIALFVCSTLWGDENTSVQLPAKNKYSVAPVLDSEDSGSFLEMEDGEDHIKEDE